MNFLGIDFGSKRVGIAVAEDGTKMAFPRCVLRNEDSLIQKVMEIAEELKVSKIILGESKNLNGDSNPINEDILKFKEELVKKGIDVVLVSEQFSSREASRIQGEHDMLDASSATVILQRYLDKLK